MKTVQIQFTKSTKKFAPFSWLIMWVEKTPYSHVAIRIIDEEIQLPIYYQASHTMVNSMGEPAFLAEEQVIDTFEFQIDDKLQIDFRTFATSKLGVPYGVVSTLGLGIVQLAKVFGKTINNPFKEVGATYVCSQFIGALLENYKLIDPNIDLDNMKPADIYPLVANLPKTLMAS